jgi:IS5 family transposase
MFETGKAQWSLRENWLDLDHAKELQMISRLLDDYPKIVELVLQDLRATPTGRRRTTCRTGSLSAEQILRVLVVKQMNGFSYRDLAFHLVDSRSYRTFCRFGITDRPPSRSALNQSLKSIQQATLEAIHRIVIGAAKEEKIETGRKVRTDCTVVESNIHEPRDSELLWDGVRVVTRLLGRARKLLGSDTLTFGNRTRRAKRRRLEITNAKNPKDRQRAYRDLLQVTAEVYACGQTALDLLRTAQASLDLMQSFAAQGLANDLDHYLPLVHKVIDQTRRRVLEGQSVPAEEKIVSIFEEHTDIIRKDNRETFYGHKICLTGGASSMILDCTVLRGNPADTTLAKTMVDRQAEIFSRPPRQIVFDGGFASKVNLDEIKAAGVKDVAFSKRRGMEIGAMVKSTWVYKRLRNFRAGIEGNISFLKRIFGLGRCTWKSWSSFQSYVWGSIFSFNLLVFARHQLKRDSLLS